MKRSTVKILSILNIIAMVVLMFLFRYLKPAMIICGIVCMIINLFLNYLLRCPCCGRWPRKGDFWDQYCPHCGTPYE